MPDPSVGRSGYSGPGRYRHYKGGEYEVLGIALQEDTVLKRHDPPNRQLEIDALNENRRFVIYRPLTPGSMIGPDGEESYRDCAFWARDLRDFNAMVTVDLPRFDMPSLAGQQPVGRFKRIADA